jgi:tRNA (Thr-GGU) A37 N-methylase
MSEGNDPVQAPETPALIVYWRYFWHYIYREGSVIRRAPLAFIASLGVFGLRPAARPNTIKIAVDARLGQFIPLARAFEWSA